MASSPLSVWMIYGLVVLYALCFQFQRPIEPFLVDKLVKGRGADATLALGRVDSFFNVAQGIGSLIMGYILDKFGVKAGLVVNFLACAGQYFILSITDSLSMLFLSKVPGMMMGGFLCAQTAISKVTDEGPDRVAALGRLTSAYTVGGLVGPFLGGMLGSSGNYFLGAQLATAGSLLAIGVVLLLPSGLDAMVVPEDKNKKKSEDKESSVKSTAEGVPQGWLSQAALVLSLVGTLLATKVITGISNNMARSVQSVILKNDLGFDEAKMGSVMSGQFAFGGFANAFLLAPLTKLLGGDMEKVVRNCVLTMGAAYMLEAAIFSPTLGIFTLGSALTGSIYISISLFLAVFQYSLATSITAKSQSLVPKSMTGTLMGLEHSIFAFAGMLGPLAGTSIFQSYGVSGLCLVCGLFFFGSLPIIQVATKSKHA
eukprot:TRINITY_DN60803_c0_g1_i1.p1 TRINITY_DN60803_c0_g1~~TRINITY_DN60803_c0_g1_i1.p1  ORF type:complete len:427 (-),score=66.62 TRINITY_DN60803_c0_g1_i1:9-1289(-)